jgi:hypothetical protein
VFVIGFSRGRAAAQNTRLNPTATQNTAMFCSEPQVIAVDDDFAE